MDNKFKAGEHVIVTFHEQEVLGIVGRWDEERETLWVDLGLMDSIPPDHIVYTGFKLEECREFTKKDKFIRDLQGRGAGLYENK